MEFNAPSLQVLAPLLFVVGTLYLLAPTLTLSSWTRAAVFLVVWMIVARYLNWRIFTTVWPAEGPWYEVGWIWLCLVVELFAMLDSLILYITFLRRSDRRREADAHEARLRAKPAHELPTVDVYIATYNEPLDVLEKTITGALCLDYPNFKVWVLDDGRRPWLKDFCTRKGAGYITRPDNAHAKAGNINHALRQTNADYVVVLDADFIIQREFLMRTIGFFDDPAIGIVQVPHTFYNHDPMQTNLALSKALPDDQRFFFEAIMPSRDAWNAAFCCGSNSVTRRAALRSIGDALPTESITEDMLLTLKMLREGFVTRYLCERLAFGLAPEGLQAFFVQRRRWARGAIQILYLAAGPLGKGLTLMQRLLFLPTHWLTQSLTYLFGVVVPLVYLWTGVLPMVNVSPETVAYYVLPMILAVVGGICVYAPKQYFPLAVQVLGTFQCFKLLPSILATFFQPHGHVFKVTPKGGEARTAGYDREVFWAAATLLFLTITGLIINVMPEWRIITQSALIPVVAGWATYNMIVLFLVCMMSLQGNVQRGEERIACNEPILIMGPGDERILGDLKDISLSGAGIVVPKSSNFLGRETTPLKVLISEVGFVSAHIARTRGDLLGLEFELEPGLERDLLIRKIFTSGLPATNVKASAWTATAALLQSIVLAPSSAPQRAATASGTMKPEKLPAQTLVIAPIAEQPNWALLAKHRAAVA